MKEVILATQSRRSLLNAERGHSDGLSGTKLCPFFIQLEQVECL